MNKRTTGFPDDLGGNMHLGDVPFSELKDEAPAGKAGFPNEEAHQDQNPEIRKLRDPLTKE